MSKCIYLASDGWCDRLAGTPCDKVCEDSSEKPCKDKVEKVVTNADRIRNMTDEELADLGTRSMCGLCIICHYCRENRYNRPCDEVWLEWLKQEVTE